MTTAIWSDLALGDLYSFQSDSLGNVYMKCGTNSMCLLIDKGGAPDLSDRNDASVLFYDNVSAYIGSLA